MNNWWFFRCLLNPKTSQIAIDLIDWGLSDEGVDGDMECQHLNFSVDNENRGYTFYIKRAGVLNHMGE